MGEKVLEELRSSTRFGAVREWAEIDSTNRWLLAAARNAAPEGLVAVADHQSAGRGRLGRVWTAPPGSALLVSVLLRPAGLTPADYHLVTSAVALAAREACGRHARVVAGLKWPNDLVVEDRKLAGILAEADGGALVIGLGLNVSSAPPDAAALAEWAPDGPPDRGELLGSLLMALEGYCGHWEEVASAYRAACVTIGRRVRVETAGAELTGRAVDVDDDGRLVLERDGGARVVLSVGDVVHLRDAPSSEPG